MKKFILILLSIFIKSYHSYQDLLESERSSIYTKNNVSMKFNTILTSYFETEESTVFCSILLFDKKSKAKYAEVNETYNTSLYYNEEQIKQENCASLDRLLNELKEKITRSNIEENIKSNILDILNNKDMINKWKNNEAKCILTQHQEQEKKLHEILSEKQQSDNPSVHQKPITKTNSKKGSNTGTIGIIKIIGIIGIITMIATVFYIYYNPSQ